jgi:hypothetical protein
LLYRRTPKNFTDVWKELKISIIEQLLIKISFKKLIVFVRLK